MDKKVDWVKLTSPGKTIFVFQPTPEKIQIWTNRLLHEYLFISDEFRDIH